MSRHHPTKPPAAPVHLTDCGTAGESKGETMSPTRRDFLKTTGAVGAGLAVQAAAPLGGLAQPPRQNPKRLLILGGTGFIGPHMVRYAVERGHAARPDR